MRDTPSPDRGLHSDSIETVAGRRRWIGWLVVVLLVIAAAGAWWWWRSVAPAPPADGDAATPTKRGARFDPTKSVVPVALATAGKVDMPVRISALGTVTARGTVTVKARVDGLLERVNFREGQLVKAGQVLAQIDAKPFEVQLQQAQGQLERDRAQLQNAQKVDNQAALVRQYEATLLTDQAAVESARLSLSYTKIRRPRPAGSDCARW